MIKVSANISIGHQRLRILTKRAKIQVAINLIPNVC